MPDVARQRPELAPEDPRHGTTNAYGNLGCRCAPCTEAHRRHHRGYMQRVRRDGALLDAGAPHGTAYKYDVGCRCGGCKDAHNAKSRATKARLRERQAASGS